MAAASPALSSRGDSPHWRSRGESQGRQLRRIGSVVDICSFCLASMSSCGHSIQILLGRPTCPCAFDEVTSFWLEQSGCWLPLSHNTHSCWKLSGGPEQRAYLWVKPDLGNKPKEWRMSLSWWHGLRPGPMSIWSCSCVNCCITEAVYSPVCVQLVKVGNLMGSARGFSAPGFPAGRETDWCSAGWNEPPSSWSARARADRGRACCCLQALLVLPFRCFLSLSLLCFW